MTIIEVGELAGRLSEVLKQAVAGDEVVVTDKTVPVARLLPIQPQGNVARIPGLHPGAITTTDDFDAPLPDDFWTGNS